MLNLNKDVKYVKTVGPNRVKLLNKLKIYTLKDKGSFTIFINSSSKSLNKWVLYSVLFFIINESIIFLIFVIILSLSSHTIKLIILSSLFVHV